MENKNLKLVKACIYRKGDIYFPVAFMAEPNSAEYEYDQYNAERRVRMSPSGRPYTNGCTIIPMGATPIKGKFNMSLTNFEDILAKYDCHFHCVIPHKELKDASEVFDAFRWMMYGCNHLPAEDDKANDEYKLSNLAVRQGEDSLETAIRILCDQGLKLKAIALYRYVHPCTLSEGKAAVDAIQFSTN